MKQKLVSETLRILAIFAGLALTLFWCVIAFTIDFFDFVGISAYEQASRVAYGLAVVSAVGFLIAGGIFGDRRVRWVVAAVLISGHTVIACYLNLYRNPYEN